MDRSCSRDRLTPLEALVSSNGPMADGHGFIRIGLMGCIGGSPRVPRGPSAMADIRIGDYWDFTKS